MILDRRLPPTVTLDPRSLKLASSALSSGTNAEYRGSRRSSRTLDPYLDPVGGVLRNLLGITDAAELARAEAALSASRLIDLERRRLPGRYDFAHLQAFHRCILGDVYAWAGQQFAHDAGHHIAWVRMDPDRNMTASAAAHHGDLAPLRDMLDQLTDLPQPDLPATRSVPPAPAIARCSPAPAISRTQAR
jgi:hypothetical protein